MMATKTLYHKTATLEKRKFKAQQKVGHFVIKHVLDREDESNEATHEGAISVGLSPSTHDNYQ